MHPKETKFLNFRAEFIDSEINKLLEKGVIVRSCHETNEFISKIFVDQNQIGLIIDINLKKFRSVKSAIKNDKARLIKNPKIPEFFLER